MVKVIAQTKYEALEPGTYRARLAAVSLEKSEYSDSGEQVAMRWDILEEGLEDRSIRAWANPKLTGGKKPSKLYQWCSALLFGGRPLPEGYALDLDDLLDRDALLVVEVKPDTGYNKIASILPLRRAAPPTRNAPQAAPVTQPASEPTTQASAGPDWPDRDWDNLAVPEPTEEDEG